MMSIRDFHSKIQEGQDSDRAHNAFRQLSQIRKPAKTLQESTQRLDDWLPWY